MENFKARQALSQWGTGGRWTDSGANHASGPPRVSPRGLWEQRPFRISIYKEESKASEPTKTVGFFCFRPEPSVCEEQTTTMRSAFFATSLQLKSRKQTARIPQFWRDFRRKIFAKKRSAERDACSPVGRSLLQACSSATCFADDRESKYDPQDNATS